MYCDRNEQLPHKSQLAIIFLHLFSDKLAKVMVAGKGSKYYPTRDLQIQGAKVGTVQR